MAGEYLDPSNWPAWMQSTQPIFPRETPQLMNPTWQDRLETSEMPSDDFTHALEALRARAREIPQHGKGNPSLLARALIGLKRGFSGESPWEGMAYRFGRN